MDKKLSIDVNVLSKGSLDMAAGMRGYLDEISSLDELKKLIDLLQDSKDLELIGHISISGNLEVKSATLNTAV